MARKLTSAESAPGAVETAFAAPAGSPPQPYVTGEQPIVVSDPTTAILNAVEQQLTRYFGAMAARVEAVQQSGEASRAELVNHFQQQVDLLRAELERSRDANDGFERALQAAIEERLTDFAATQHWRFGEIEGRVERLNEELTLGSPGFIEAATAPIQQRFDRTTELLATRIEELQKAARRFDEQSSALVQHVNDTTSSLSRRLDETGRSFTGQLDDRTLAFSQRIDEAMTGLRSHVADQTSQLTRRIEDSDNRVVDRALAMEERINEQTGVRLAAVEATIGRISGGIDDAIVALSHRVIELENLHTAASNRIDELAEQVAAVDQEAINQLREQMSSAVGESMLVRIELERVATSTNETFDKLNVRLGELAAQIADTDLDVSTAVQLERLEEIERALAELNPDTFVRKDELGGTTNGSAVSGGGATHLNGDHSAMSYADDSGSHGDAGSTTPSESNLSSW